MNNLHFFSQQGEDLLIFRNFINNVVKDGIFVELGACNGLTYSNTKFFENNLGFTGILIEPIKEMYDKLIRNRPKCICINKAISLETDDVNMIVNGAVSGIKKSMTENFIKSWHKRSIERLVKTTTMSQIFQDNKIEFVDFLSVDVEGGELDVLNTINWEDVPIYLICIELDGHNPIKNEECRKILINNGFQFRIKMCINEFWLNPNYLRKDLLFNPSKKK